MTVAEISGIVFLVALFLWIFWPKKPGERIGRSWWSLPWSTNETRNTIGGVAMWGWFVYMAATFKGTFWLVLAVIGGVNVAILALMWLVDRPRR